MLTQNDIALLERNIDRLSPEQAVALVQQASAEDGSYWLRWVQTRDEADRDNPVKLFPVGKPYVRPYWAALMDSQVVVVAKSRQVMASWETCAFCCWWARYKPHQVVLWQTKGWEDAVRMVAMPEGGFEGRCQFIENHLPVWMRVDIKVSEGRIQYPNGSIIQALAGGADKPRSHTPSLYVADEFAHQDDQEGVWTAVAPLIQKGAKLIFISTPNGATNQFATLFHGYKVGG